MSYVDLIADDVRELAYEAASALLVRAYNAVMATDATVSAIGTLPGTDGAQKVWADLAPETDEEAARALLPLIVFRCMQASRGSFSTFDGDAPTVTVSVDCAALDRTTAGDLARSVRERMRWGGAWQIPGFRVVDITITDGARIETRARWPAIFHVDLIATLILSD